MRRIVIAALSMSVLVTAAHASIFFYEGNAPEWIDENILFQGNETGPSIAGTTNQSGELIDFYGAGIDLTSGQSEGQARLEGADGQTFTALSIARQNPNVGFTGLALDIRLAQGQRSGTVTFNVDSLGGGSTQSQELALGNGQNFFTIYSTNPAELLSQLSFTTTGDVADVRHVRIGGVTPVPEPAGVACLALGGLVLLRRKRKK